MSRLFPLVQLPKKLEGKVFLVNGSGEQIVSISSTSEEVRRGKRDRARIFFRVSISSTSEEVRRYRSLWDRTWGPTCFH